MIGDTKNCAVWKNVYAFGMKERQDLERSSFTLLYKQCNYEYEHISSHDRSLKFRKINSSNVSNWRHCDVTKTMTVNAVTDNSDLNSSKMRRHQKEAKWNDRPRSHSTHLGSWTSSREEGSQYTKITVDIHSQACSQVSISSNLKKSE